MFINIYICIMLYSDTYINGEYIPLIYVGGCSHQSNVICIDSVTASRILHHFFFIMDTTEKLSSVGRLYSLSVVN